MDIHVARRRWTRFRSERKRDGVWVADDGAGRTCVCKVVRWCRLLFSGQVDWMHDGREVLLLLPSRETTLATATAITTASAGNPFHRHLGCKHGRTRIMDAFLLAPWTLGLCFPSITYAMSARADINCSIGSGKTNTIPNSAIHPERDDMPLWSDKCAA